MFEYYSAMIYIVIFTLLIMLSIVYYDEILPPRSKRGFFITFVMLIITALAEWFSTYLNGTGPSFRVVNVISTFLVAIITPVVPVVLAWSITDFKKTGFVRLLLIINVLMHTANLYYGFIYRIDANNRYLRGEYLWVGLPIIIYCVSFLFYRVYIITKKYQTRNAYILMFIASLLVVGLVFQLLFLNVTVVWISATITALLLYAYYSAVVNEVDALTNLLNRRCFENELGKSKDGTIVVIFDVDKFKVVNDKYGHNFGDVNLIHIAEIIREVYRPYGFCYRIGGDEFCVIIKNLEDDMIKLNEDFVRRIKNKIDFDSRMATVSVGYGVVSLVDGGYKKAMEDADKMMYNVKKNNEKFENWYENLYKN